MARKATPALTAKMYRHFAVLTVAITASVAVFAEGEGRKVAAVETAKPQPPAASEDFGKLVRNDPAPTGSFAGGDAFDASFGSPMDDLGSTDAGGFIPSDFADGARSGMPHDDVYGVSPDIWATLTAEQRKAVIARNQAERAAAESPERAREINALVTSARARAGQAARDD